MENKTPLQRVEHTLKCMITNGNISPFTQCEIEEIWIHYTNFMSGQSTKETTIQSNVAKFYKDNNFKVVEEGIGWKITLE